MRMTMVTLCLLLAALGGCSQRPPASLRDAETKDRPIGWPKDWSKHLGQRVTLEGTAANAKVGPLLEGDGEAIWIDGMDYWPEGFYPGQGKGKRLRVTGTVIKRGDLPVFVQKQGELPRAGMPVKNKDELEKAKWRFLLKDATWTVVE